MKIKSINITNFKNIKDIAYVPDNKTVALIGKNGTGKTSFKEALYAGITGDFPDNCISEGESSTSVKIELEDGTIFERIINADKPNKVLVNGRTATAKGLHELLELKTGISRNTMKIVGSADVIESMKADEFGNFIAGYIPEKLDYDTVTGYIPGITPEMEKIMSEIIPSMPCKFDMGKLKDAYVYFTEQRKYTKKEVTVRKAKVTSFSESEEPRPLKAIEEDLNEIAKKEGKQDAIKSALTLYNIAVENKKKIEKNMEDIKAQVDAISAGKPSPSELEEIEKGIKDCEKLNANVEAIINTINHNTAVFKNTLDNLDKPVCPLSESLVCTTDKSKVKEEIKEVLESNKEGIVIQEEIIRNNNEKLKELKEKKKDYDERLKLYEKKVFLNAQYEKLKKSIPILPAKPEVPETESYEEEKRALQRERDNAVAYANHLKDMDELRILESKCMILEQLCKIFEPKGEVMSSIMRHYMAVFEDVCNERADELKTGFKIKFVSEEGVSYLVKTASATEYKTYESLSSGEKAIVLFLIIDMLNTLSGLRILMIDDLDKLDKEMFESLINVLQSAAVQDSYDHIVICSVDHEDIVRTLSGYSNIDYIF